MKSLILLFVLLLTVVLPFSFGGREKIAFALPAVAEWKTGDFSIEIKDWDNPLGIEGINNSGLNKDTCTYQVESLNPATGAWEITRTTTTRTCAIPIPITVGLKTGEGYKGTTDIVVQTTDCKYSGENACRITAWAEDYAGNNSLGTESMLTRIYSIDFGPPQAKIIGISPSPTFPVLKQAWLRGENNGAINKTYTLSISYAEESGDTRLSLCQLWIYDTTVADWDVTTIPCSGTSKNTTFNLIVGPNPGAHCKTESGPSQEPTCYVWVQAWDGANRISEFLRAPENRGVFTLPGNETNFLPLQVDWTAPTAQ